MAAALAVLASQQGGDGTGGGPLNAIAEAAERTQREPGGRAVMRAVVTSPKLPGPLTMTGRMVFDSEGRNQAVISVPDPKFDSPMRLEMINEGAVIYLRSDRFGPLPEGRKWMSIDLDRASGEKPETPLPTEMDPQGELAALESLTGEAKKLGKEEVRGVPTTRYRIDEEEDGSPLNIEAWIDADKLVRRMRIVHPASGDEGPDSETIDMRIDFFDFGIDPQIDVPDSSEVFDATELARSSDE